MNPESRNCGDDPAAAGSLSNATSEFGLKNTDLLQIPKKVTKEKFMDENSDPQAAADSAKDHVKAAAQDFKTAASAKADEIRRAAQKKADELRVAAEGKAREFRGTAESAWSDARSRARNWQSDGEAYVRENPAKAVLIAVGVGFLLGLILRK